MNEIEQNLINEYEILCTKIDKTETMICSMIKSRGLTETIYMKCKELETLKELKFRLEVIQGKWKLKND